jgi:hypothetical protein
MKKIFIIYFLLIIASNSYAAKQCDLSLLPIMAEEGLNVNMASCLVFKRFSVMNIKNGGQHIFTIAPKDPDDTSMEATALTITRDKNKKVVSCGFGDSEMNPFERADAINCVNMVPKGVPDPLMSTGVDETMKVPAKVMDKPKSCPKTIDFKNLNKAIEMMGWPKLAKSCFQVGLYTFDVFAKNGQMKYRIYFTKGEAINLMLNNEKTIMCGSMNEALSEISILKACDEIEVEDQITRKYLEPDMKNPNFNPMLMSK